MFDYLWDFSPKRKAKETRIIDDMFYYILDNNLPEKVIEKPLNNKTVDECICCVKNMINIDGMDTLILNDCIPEIDEYICNGCINSAVKRTTMFITYREYRDALS